MRYLTSILTVLLLAACADVTGSSYTTPEGSGTYSAAAPVLTRISIEESGVFEEAEGCVGEPIAFDFRQEMVIHEVYGPGDRFHGRFHFVDRGSTGVGLETGLRYRFTVSQHEGVNITGKLPFTFSATYNVRVISQGPTPNWVVHNLAQFTINGRGDVTVDRSEFSRRCIGDG